MNPPNFPFMAQAVGMIGPWLGAADVPPAIARPAPAAVVQPPSIPPASLGLNRLKGNRALLLADGENLSYGLRGVGLDCDYRKLRELLAGRVGQLEAHAFVTTFAEAPRRYAERYFAKAGWTPHVQVAAPAAGPRDGARKANSDNDILIMAGALLMRQRPDVLIMGTGDGDLGTAILRFCARHLAHTQVLVCSLHGSTSRRLNGAHNPAVSGNIWIGADCIDRIIREQEEHHG